MFSYTVPDWMIEQGYSITIATRFLKYTNKTESCWLWVGCKKQGGYGVISFQRGRMMLAHRLSWMLHNGPIPESFQVLHNCPGGDNSGCVNPSHLWLGHDLENHQDAAKKNRTTKGERNAMHKLTEVEVKAIKSTAPYRGYVKALAIKYSVRHTAISKIIHGKRWAHVI